MKKLKFIALIIAGTVIVSCQSNTTDEVKGAVVTSPTYNNNVAAVFNNNCISCHSPSVAANQTPYLRNYTEVKNATQTGGLVICRIEGTSCGSIMPPAGRMSQSTIDMVKLWATQGFAN